MKKFILSLLVITTICTSCENDDLTHENNTDNVETTNNIDGLYIMCEGNWGSNNSAIDYLDFKTGQYTENIYSLRNPDVVMGLGDACSDLKINGQQLWIVVNASNKVEIVSKDSCKRIAKIDIPNCRYVTFHDSHAYISSYVGPMADDNVQLGTIYKINSNNFDVVDSVVVSYQPEEMEIIDNKLYVACSGGYRYPLYDRVVSVIDLNTFKKIKDIDTAVNLHRLRKDSNNQLWVTSRGNYTDERPSLIWFNEDKNGIMTPSGTIDIAVSDMCIIGDSLYYFGVEWNESTYSNIITYGIINTKTHEKVPTTIFDNEVFKDIEVPYGIIVTPQEKDIFITDAKNYVSSGQIYHFNSEGKFMWSKRTSDIPSKMVFHNK